ncbi:MAG: hypothetical protein J6U26_01775, partial [Lachnospiraceae bacterium]|nr:hypothetical protein [Lachnospiraceae bacterium]
GTLESSLKAAQDSNTSLEASLNEAREPNASLEASLTDAQDSNDTLEADLKEARETNDTLEADLLEAQEAKEALEAELETAKADDTEYDAWLLDRLTRLGKRYGIPEDVIAGLLDGTYLPPELRPETPYDGDLGALAGSYIPAVTGNGTPRVDLAHRIVLREDGTCTVGGAAYTWKAFTAEDVFIKVLDGENVTGRITWSASEDGSVNAVSYAPEDSAETIRCTRDLFEAGMAGTYALAADHTTDSSAAASLRIGEDGTAVIGGRTYTLFAAAYPGFYDADGIRAYSFSREYYGETGEIYAQAPALQLRDGILTLQKDGEPYETALYATFIHTGRYESVELTAENFWDYFTALDFAETVTLNRDAFGGIESFGFAADRLAARMPFSFYAYAAEIRRNGSSRPQTVTYDASSGSFTFGQGYDTLSNTSHGRNTVFSDQSAFYPDTDALLRGRQVFDDYYPQAAPVSENGLYTASYPRYLLDWNLIRVSGKVWYPVGEAPEVTHQIAPTLAEGPEYEGETEDIFHTWQTFRYEDSAERFCPDLALSFLEDHSCRIGEKMYTWKAVSANQVLILDGDTETACVVFPAGGEGRPESLSFRALEETAQTVTYYRTAFDPALAGTYDTIGIYTAQAGYPLRIEIRADGSVQAGEEALTLLVFPDSTYRTGFYDGTGRKAYGYSGSEPGLIRFGEYSFLCDALYAYNDSGYPDMFRPYYMFGDYSSDYAITHTVSVSEDHSCTVDGEMYRWEAVYLNQYILRDAERPVYLLYFDFREEDGEAEILSDSFRLYTIADPGAQNSYLRCFADRGASLAGSYELLAPSAPDGVPGQVVIAADGTVSLDGQDLRAVHTGSRSGLYGEDGSRASDLTVYPEGMISLRINGSYYRYIDTGRYHAVDLTAENFRTYFTYADRSRSFTVTKDSFGTPVRIYKESDGIVPKEAYAWFSYALELTRPGSYRQDTVLYHPSTGQFEVRTGEESLDGYANTVTVTDSSSNYQDEAALEKGRPVGNDAYISPLTESGGSYAGSWRQYDADWTISRILGKVWF